MSNSKTERFQTVGTILALMISIIAMVTSIYEANIMKSQQKSMVWPYLDVSDQYNKEGFGIQIMNKGTGPAIIKSVQIDYKDNAVSNIMELMDSLNPKRTFGYNIMTNNSINHQVFSAGETKIMFHLPYNDETKVVLENKKYVRMRIAYESVLGEEWVFDSNDGSHQKMKFKKS